MQYLKADTNTEVLIGPVVAVGDGFTPVTTLSASTADEAELIKYGGATALTTTSISASAMTAITGADGYYTLDLSTGNTDTEGFLTVLFNDDSLCLPVRHDFQVVNANVYDSLFAAATTDYLQVDTIQAAGTAWASGAITASSLASSAITSAKIASGAITSTGIAASAIGASQLATGAITSTKFAASAINAAAIAADAITAAKIATDAIGSDELATGAVTKIWAQIVETVGSRTAQQALSIILAAVAGVTADAGATIKDAAGTNTRISATINGSNERTAMTLTPSS